MLYSSHCVCEHVYSSRIVDFTSVQSRHVLELRWQRAAAGGWMAVTDGWRKMPTLALYTCCLHRAAGGSPLHLALS